MSRLALEQFGTQLAAMLRDLPAGTTADLTDYAVAFWNGSEVVYAFLFDDGSGRVGETFVLGDYEWKRWQDDFASWIAEPAFSVRPELSRRTWSAPVGNGGR
ncbi:hypothetical protein LFL96_36595 (plasmid) [Paraburkholderia sp. D15]|uniref:hypothetical protein n=1 Tax=Paraburkholderia sp. D15 TaxID=2880218 RepID=UPI0024796D6E|nr:hypothetical protein [Paraburkholderia sp. D15]WGS55001.1 hypothetical protein LFL96_36595 [Paraburkholderia sp. D15]